MSESPEYGREVTSHWKLSPGGRVAFAIMWIALVYWPFHRIVDGHTTPLYWIWMILGGLVGLMILGAAYDPDASNGGGQVEPPASD